MSSAIRIRFFVAGHCLMPGAAFAPDQAGRVEVPVYFTLIEHPQALVLFDTGGSSRVIQQASRFPFVLTRSLFSLEMRPEHEAAYQLSEAGTAPTDVRLVIVSHFHPDHVGGLRDFPEAVFLYWRKSYDGIKSKGLLGRFRRGFMPELLPADFEPRSRYLDGAIWVRLEPEFAPFDSGWDVFEDRTVFAVPLPGHAEGQVGLLVRAHDATYFLVADACYSSQAYRELVLPKGSAMRWLHHDPVKYAETLTKLHALHKKNPSIRIVPSHCAEARHFWD
ncbi:MAG: MBL fold metallo-hydrolase [Armatimonadetes bacterium]|nr:MBL fold metallo-hydrolase [Armatimonadota bacterium]